jgi:hypothetical protein
MSEILTSLYNELHSAISNQSLTLPNNSVSAVDVNDFLQHILKTSEISFTDASVSLEDSTLTLTSIKLPSILSGFEFTDLSFYWCDRAQILPDGTSCDVGVGYKSISI